MFTYTTRYGWAMAMLLVLAVVATFVTLYHALSEIHLY